jgi:hypothetical protein
MMITGSQAYQHIIDDLWAIIQGLKVLISANICDPSGENI